MTFGAYLWALFTSAFVSATLLPGGSEALLAWGVHEFKDAFWLQIAVATVGNSLGSMVTYAIGRLIPNKAKGKAVEYVRQWGVYSLLFAWLPVVGDGLCLAAGWFKLPVIPSFIFITVGKLVRYCFVAGAVGLVFA